MHLAGARAPFPGREGCTVRARRGAAGIAAQRKGAGLAVAVHVMLKGFYWQMSFVLPFGEAIHDYLKNGPA